MQIILYCMIYKHSYTGTILELYRTHVHLSHDEKIPCTLWRITCAHSPWFTAAPIISKAFIKITIRSQHWYTDSDSVAILPLDYSRIIATPHALTRRVRFLSTRMYFATLESLWRANSRHRQSPSLWSQSLRTFPPLNFSNLFHVIFITCLSLDSLRVGFTNSRMLLLLTGL